VNLVIVPTVGSSYGKPGAGPPTGGGAIAASSAVMPVRPNQAERHEDADEHQPYRIERKAVGRRTSRAGVARRATPRF
jgi:hypothetical protein